MPEDAKHEEFVEAYPAVLLGASQWMWSQDSKFSGGIVPVSESGLKALLQYVRDSQSFLMGLAMHDDRERQGEEFSSKCRFSELADLMNRSSTVIVEGDLCMSNLFVTGTPVRNKHIEENDDGSFAKGPGRRDVTH